MVIKLNKEMSELLLKEVEDIEPLIVSQREVDRNTVELDVSDIDEMQLLINDEIVYRGLNNQETVNDLGEKLYALYDEILYQKHNNQYRSFVWVSGIFILFFSGGEAI